MKREPVSKDRVAISVWVPPTDVQGLDALAAAVGGSRSLVMIAAMRVGLEALASEPGRVAVVTADYLRSRHLKK